MVQDTAVSVVKAGSKVQIIDGAALKGMSGGHEARQTVNAAFDAMSAWRIDMAHGSEKNSEQVIE